MENCYTDTDSNNRSKGLQQTLGEYINLKIDEYKLKGVNGLSLLTSKAIFLLLVTMLGGVILQLLGLSLAFYISYIVGSEGLGFLIVAIGFALVMAILFIMRKRLFLNRLVRLYIDLFFRD